MQKHIHRKLMWAQICVDVIKMYVSQPLDIFYGAADSFKEFKTTVYNRKHLNSALTNFFQA